MSNELAEYDFVEWGPEGIAELSKEVQRTKGATWYKFQVGVNEIRILPPRRDFGIRHPIYVAVEHLIDPAKFDVPGQESVFGFLCPETYGQSCPVCKLCRTIEAQDVKSQADKELIEVLSTKLKYYANVVDMAEPELGPQRANFSPGVYAKIEALANMEGDFCHPITGYSIKVKRVGEGKRTRYPLATAGQRGELENWREHLAACSNPKLFSRTLSEELEAALELACSMYAAPTTPRPRQVGGFVARSRPTVTAQDTIRDDSTY